MKKIIILISVLLLVNSLSGESLTQKLEEFGVQNGKAYIGPWVTSFGTNLNTGLYQSAKVMKPFLFGVTVNSMLAFVPDEDKSFTAYSPTFEYDGQTYNLYNEEKLKTATIFGDQGATFTLNDNIPEEINTGDLDLKMPNGGNLTAVPLLVPQVQVGLPAGNELLLRVFPKIQITEDIGELSFWGVGLKHSISQYIPLIPIDLALQGMYQQMDVGDLIKISSFAANAQISKKLLMWTIYGGLGYEKSSMNVKYDGTVYEANDAGDGNYVLQALPEKIEFDIDGENEIRMTAGIRYSIAIIKIYADYTLSKYNVLNFGLGLSF
ncbi:MAG: hypothetical protein APR54_01920 [Candidatus Cloacimonas sp. SDB]|nr:MAG: hypothetical protein APR54_01920 [Candidatus Cloacimonas sp. SDB]